MTSAKFLGRSVLLLGLAVGLLCYGDTAHAAPIKPSVVTQQSLIVQAGPRLGPRVESRGYESGDYYTQERKRAAEEAAQKARESTEGAPTSPNREGWSPGSEEQPPSAYLNHRYQSGDPIIRFDKALREQARRLHELSGKEPPGSLKFKNHMEPSTDVSDGDK